MKADIQPVQIPAGRASGDAAVRHKTSLQRAALLAATAGLFLTTVPALRRAALKNGCLEIDSPSCSYSEPAAWPLLKMLLRLLKQSGLEAPLHPHPPGPWVHGPNAGIPLPIFPSGVSCFFPPFNLRSY